MSILGVMLHVITQLPFCLLLNLSRTPELLLSPLLCKAILLGSKTVPSTSHNQVYPRLQKNQGLTVDTINPASKQAVLKMENKPPYTDIVCQAF